MKQPNRLWALCLSAVLAVSGCMAVAEMTGADTQSLNAQAAKSYAQVVNAAQQKGVLDTTSQTARRVHTIFNNLKPYADAANQTGVPFEWQLSVIRKDELNAFVMPGGKTVVYTGIVEKLNLTDGEIAAIVGHEMTHALHEHSKKDAGQKVITGVAAAVVGSVASAYTGTDLTSITNIAAGLGIDKPFSRSQETDADMGGLRLMAQAGYNPEEAVRVWEKMNKASNNNNVILGLLSTHPTNNARIENIRKALPQVMPIYQQSKVKR